MASITYEIDPDGDIDLVLKDPNTQNIVPVINDPVATCDRNDTFENPPLVGRYEIFNIVNKSCDGEASENKAVGNKTGGGQADVSNAGSNKVSDSAEVRMRVSSRHLILASRTFRKMLEGGWSEGSSEALQSGRRQIETSGWNAAALAIVLDTIHGRYREIPKYTNLGLLTRIATIIDYYQCHESLELIAQIWITSLCDKVRVPESICKTSLLWLYISWVFSKPHVAAKVTKMLLEDSFGLSDIELFDLPLAGVLDIIETKRQQLIGKIISGLNALRKILSEEEGCLGSNDPNCSAIMLGILVREQHKLRLLDPHLAAPYNGHSINYLKIRINAFPSSRPQQKSIAKSPEPEPKPETRPSPYYGYNSTPKAVPVPTQKEEDEKPCYCNLSGRLRPMLKKIESDLAKFEVTTEQDPRQ